MGGAVTPKLKTPAQGNKLSAAMKSFKKDPKAFRARLSNMPKSNLLANRLKSKNIEEEDKKKTILG
tara:strand:- start:430 stop:627 length:198 start_codon:yes stop_codon:yes gene_type:complete